jgi:hypothetical protein
MMGSLVAFIIMNDQVADKLLTGAKKALKIVDLRLGCQNNILWLTTLAVQEVKGKNQQGQSPQELFHEKTLSDKRNTVWEAGQI